MTANDEIVILHNPRCSKSRETLALLEARGIRPRIVPYLDSPPSVAELERIVTLLGIEPHALLRRGEAEYAELDLAAAKDDLGRILRAMHEHPRLIERPIVIHGNRAAIGRPPEAVLSIL